MYQRISCPANTQDTAEGIGKTREIKQIDDTGKQC